MAAKSQTDEASVADLSSGSNAFEENCLLCGTDLGLDWPDLSKLDPVDIKNHAPDDWRRAANSGCPFCNIVISVVDDAKTQHGCSISDYYGIITGLPDRDDYTVKGFQVYLGLNRSTKRYLLALEFVMMPLLVDPGKQNRFWGTMTVYLDGSDTFNTQLESFFEIPKRGGSAKALNIARDWLTTCQNEHPDCSGSLREDEDITAPSDSWIRILEICEETLRLMPAKLGQTVPPYVALSHCWGLCPTLRTLSTNIERFRIGIEHRSLPSTFQDAVEVSQSLGFKYIWIDSLCIIQDSTSDWEEQSVLMASIYGNADLVLAASSASSTADGFLQERKGYRESALQITSARSQGKTLNLRYRLLQPKGMEPVLDPLDCRAWALQERLLARRYLAIGSHDTSWTCLTSSTCECEWWRVASIWRNEIMNVKKLIQDATVEELGGFWRRKVLRHYFRRGLTFPSDNLVALSAIASIFHKKSKSKYFAGIWQHDLLPGLLWGINFPASDSSYHSDHSAPSWSWASLPTLEITELMETGEYPPFEAQVRVLETRTIMSTLNQFGFVSSGFIKLRGPLWRAEIAASELASASATWSPQLKVKGYLENEFLVHFDTSLIMIDVCLPDQSEESSLRRVRSHEVKDTFYVEIAQESKKITLEMVPLLKKYYKSRNFYIIWGLILGRSPKDSTKFERVGIFSTKILAAVGSRQHHEVVLEDCIEQELVII